MIIYYSYLNFQHRDQELLYGSISIELIFIGENGTSNDGTG